MPTCFICKETVTTVNGLFLHFDIKHHSHLFTIFKCGENGCYRKWSLRNSLRKHLLGSNHNFPAWSIKSIRKQCNNPESLNDNINDVVNSEILSTAVTEISDLPKITLTEFKSVIENCSNAFVAKLYTKSSIPRNHIQFIIDDITEFRSSHVSILKETVISQLNTLSCDNETLNYITSMFECLEDPFNHIKNEYERITYFKSCGNYIAPIKYCIGNRKVYKDNGSFLVEKVQDVYSYFIPLRQVLQQFFQLSDVFTVTMHYIDSLKDLDCVKNFIQSELWYQKRNNFDNNDIVLPLFIYYDDWEVNNPLGSHSTTLGGVYCYIPCLPPECVSRLENIFLALLFQSEDRHEFGNKIIFAPLIEELNFLEKNGITVTVNGNTHKIYFVLGLLSGDNLGLHAMCGLVESFHANYACRFCKLHRTLCETTCLEDESVLRTRTSYATDLALENISLTGIKEECVFNEVNSFHVIDNAYVDIMHDILEGIAHYDMIPIISHFIDIGDFNLSVLNQSVQMFHYGPYVQNKPPYISHGFATKSKLKMTASEMLIFCRLFGVIIGHRIKSYDDPFWKLYLLLKEIIEFLQSRSVSDDSASAFKVLVLEHHNQYMKCTKEHLKPKHHNLVHYTRIMMQSGPLIFLSTIRLEAFHKALKKIATVVMSRKNIAFSIAIRYQFSFCHRLMAQESIIPTIEVGSGNINVTKHDYFNNFASFLPTDVLCDQNSVIVNWVNYKGTRYQPKMVLICGTDESSCLNFAEIQYIVIHQNKLSFICFSLLNMGLNCDIGGFEVEKSTKWIFIKYEDLIDPFPLFVYTMATGEQYIILHHSV